MVGSSIQGKSRDSRGWKVWILGPLGFLQWPDHTGAGQHVLRM